MHLFFITGATLYMVFDWYEETMESAMKNNSSTSEDERESIMLDILKDVITGIRFIHEKQLMHGDLKPNNILINRYPDFIQASIADFGLTKYAGGNDPIWRTSKGNRHYNFCNDSTLRLSSDIVSFGAILYASMVYIKTGSSVSDDKMSELRDKSGRDLLEDEREEPEELRKFLHEELDGQSRYLLDLIFQCSCLDENKRPTANLCFDILLATEAFKECERGIKAMQIPALFGNSATIEVMMFPGFLDYILEKINDLQLQVHKEIHKFIKYGATQNSLVSYTNLRADLQNKLVNFMTEYFPEVLIEIEVEKDDA